MLPYLLSFSHTSSIAPGMATLVSRSTALVHTEMSQQLFDVLL